MFNGCSSTFYAIELKTSAGSFSFERTKEDKGDIHFHQIESLRKFATYKNVVSGFILDFRKSDNTYFIYIEDFLHIIEHIDKKSFNEADLLRYGNPVLINKAKLRVNYRYDIEKFLTDVKS
jgi:penicillin-binding protein-related factor A (putative recombinase)